MMPDIPNSVDAKIAANARPEWLLVEIFADMNYNFLRVEWNHQMSPAQC
jgi:hypothetical protein